MIYHGLPHHDVLPYVEGTEPIPFAFHVKDTDPPVFLKGFNFSSDRLSAGEVVVFVLDLFQRLVYSRTTTATVIQRAQWGRIEEPVLSSPYRHYLPSFVRTDDQGNWMDRQALIQNPFHLHHFSCGFFRLEGKQYAPIQATYFGGELFIDDFGTLNTRVRGELRSDREERPLYLLGRRVSADPKFFALHQDFFFALDAVGRAVAGAGKNRGVLF